MADEEKGRKAAKKPGAASTAGRSKKSGPSSKAGGRKTGAAKKSGAGKAGASGSLAASAAAAAMTAATNDILAYEDDPFSQAVPTPVPGGATPVARPIPQLDVAPLRVSILGAAPAPQRYTPGTPQFRYWTAAEALRRAADFWGRVLPPGTTWFSTVGPRLRVALDEGEDLNAYYNRRGLAFFHGRAGGTTVFSGESPDVISHELGHAVLDALRPQLFNAASIEAAAFHESFGDMSAILAALQLPSLRDRVLLETQGRLYRTSRLSRVAEQLGWAIRQGRPDAVDPDSLRNAVNSFFYRDPATLPPSGPANVLTSAPHNFSRVFTGAFFEALSGMLLIQASPALPSADDLLQVSEDAGRLLVAGISGAPIVPAYFSQVAAFMIAADQTDFNGRYRDVLKSAFVRHGILSLQAAAATTAPPLGVAAGTEMGMAATAAAAAGGVASGPNANAVELPTVAVTATEYGLGVETLLAYCASEPPAYPVAGAAPDLGSVTPPSDAEAAKFFIEDLFRRGRVDLQSHGDEVSRVSHPFGKKTHELDRRGQSLLLRRVQFDCGFDCQGGCA